jgi:hypothetical protein
MRLAPGAIKVVGTISQNRLIIRPVECSITIFKMEEIFIVTINNIKSSAGSRMYLEAAVFLLTRL